MKVIAMRGISCAGKSTYVRDLKRKGYAVVSRDNIRETVFNDYGSVDENFVSIIEETMLDNLLSIGRSVVIDNTNLRPKYLRKFAQIALKHNASFEVKQVDIDLKTALMRQHNRRETGGRDVPDEVIKKQLQQLNSNPLSKIDLYESEGPQWQPYIKPEGKPKAICVDLDGTLALNTGHRSYYDYTNVYNDEVVEVVADVVRWAAQNDHVIIIMSGRDDSCKDECIRWLTDNDIPYGEIYMRVTGDQRKDSIVKMELFDEFVRYNYDVSFILDDRASVVQAWRSIGLKVLQVEPGEF